MTSNSTPPSDRDKRLQEILAEYLELVESGNAPDSDEFLARYAEFADELTGFLDDHQGIEHFLTPLREKENGSDPATDPTIGFADPDVIEPGSKVRYIGDYEILEEIARGGMGVVYKARQVSLNRIVALKMILSGQLAGEEDVQRFRAEAEAAANLDHPGIVPIYEIGEFEGHHYFSMGLVEGASLAEKIKEGPLEPRTAAEYLKKIAEAVAFAHDNGVIHRDLKPGNVLLDTNDQPKVTDFGLAKRYEDDSELTATGQILGTPGYMPPEQAASMADQMGPLADVYSLGAVLYCLLTGRPPFQSANVVDTLRQVVHQEPVPPRQLNPAVPRDLETICLHCLQKAPRKRYPTAASLSEDLERYLTHHPIAARPVSRTEKAWRWAKRNPAVAGLSALAVSLLIVGITVASYFAIRANANAEKFRFEKERADAKAEQAEKAKKQSNDALVEMRQAKTTAEFASDQAISMLHHARDLTVKADQAAAEANAARSRSEEELAALLAVNQVLVRLSDDASEKPGSRQVVLEYALQLCTTMLERERPARHRAILFTSIADINSLLDRSDEAKAAYQRAREITATLEDESVITEGERSKDPLRSLEQQLTTSIYSQRQMAKLIVSVAKFVIWPKQSTPLRVGVLSDERLEDMITYELKSSTRNVDTIHFVNADSYQPCHILVVGATADFEEALEKTKGQPVLLIGQSPGLAKQGAGMNLIYDDEQNRPRLEINLKAVINAQLKISRKLLRSPIVVMVK